MEFCDKIKNIMAFDVKITTRISILDLIMPYTCRGCGHLGELLCERCKKYIIQPEMRDGWIMAVGRREGALMRLTEEYKYKSIRRTAPVLADLMERAIGELTDKDASAKVDLAGEVVVVPLPTIVKHIRERGFDHTLRLAKVLAKRRGWECRSLLTRVNKAVQVGSNAEMRKKQAKTAYELKPDAARFLKGAKDKTYLLIDDISTTGASLEAAREILQKNGAKRVFGAVVCVGLND
ncbi:ComF family protein [Candidatus Saccharibacteria bacterium]|nr:ComF family protein [Candidatus Saccharibacteria bacterium]